MKITIRLLIVLLLTVMSFSAAQAAFDCDDQDPIEIEGKVCNVQKDSKPYQIWVDPDGDCEDGSIVKIFGVPFGDLEEELSKELEDEVTIIDVGDCVTIKYYVTLYDLNKFCSLLEYCYQCGDVCYGDDMGERPFNKRKSHDHPHHGPRP